jgi:hypothetical protein
VSSKLADNAVLVTRDLAAVNADDIPWWLDDLHKRAKAVSQRVGSARESLEGHLRVVQEEVERLEDWLDGKKVDAECEEAISRKIGKLKAIRKQLKRALKPGVMEQVLDAFHGDTSWRA